MGTMASIGAIFVVKFWCYHILFFKSFFSMWNRIIALAIIISNLYFMKNDGVNNPQKQNPFIIHTFQPLSRLYPHSISYIGLLR
jgi:hypothetical protein